MSELARYVAFAARCPGSYRVLPGASDADPLVNVTGPDGVEMAVCSLPPGPDGEDLVLVPLDLL